MVTQSKAFGFGGKFNMSDEIIKLKKELDRLKKSVKKQKYGLVWMNIPEAFDNDVENKLPILKEVPDLAIKNNDGKPTTILIEGDNYHALTCLNYTHKNKIDLIYIDPPYNTGSDGFRYKDKRFINKFPDGTTVPKDNPFRHSYWLSFMQKRLELAKELLKDSGVIFISINEEELSQLKLMCDELFGPDNYLTMFSIKVRHEERILKGDKDFHEVVEYLLLYRKSKAHKTAKKIYDNTSNEDYVYEIKELTSKPQKLKLGSKIVELFSPDQYKVIKNPPDADLLKKINIRGSIKEGNSSGRFYTAYLSKIKNKRGYLIKVPDMGADRFNYRYFLMPKTDKKANGDYFQGVPIDRQLTKEVPYPNFWDFEEDFNNVGYEGGVEFRNGKKPINFLLKIFEMGGVKREKNSIVLDFFAGSASTGHALLELNSVDDGNRQCILCTNNENNICTEKCYPRLDNVINGKNGVKRLGGSLKYYKTEFIGKNNILSATDADKIELARNAGGLLAIAENTLEMVKQNKYWQLFEDANKEKYTAVYFREELDKFDEFLGMVEALKRKTTVYIFSWSSEEFSEDFDHINDVKVKTIPQPILEIYKNIYNLEGNYV